MTVIFSDDFNRASLGTTNWSDEAGVWSIDSSIQLASSSSSFRVLNTTTNAHGALADCKLTFTRRSATFDGAVVARSTISGATSGTGSCYVINPFNNNEVDIIRRVAGVNTSIGSITGITHANGDVIAVEVLGTGATVTFNVYKNGSLLGTVQDSSGLRIVTAGQTGFVVFTSSCRFDDYSVDDTSSGSVVNTNTLESTLVIADSAVTFYSRNRLLESAIAMFDELVKFTTANAIITTTLSDTITLADGVIMAAIRMRIMQDSIVISEGTTEQYATTNILFEDTLDVADQLQRFAQFFRVGSDSLTLADSLSSSIVNYLVVASVLTSNLSVTDEALKLGYFNLVLDSFLRVDDDQPLASMNRFILLSDALAVDDGLLSTYIPDGTTPGETFNPVVRIGFDQPRIDIGGYVLN